MGHAVISATRLSEWLFPALAGLVPVLGAAAPLGLAPLIGIAALAAGWILVPAAGRRWMPRGVPALLFALLLAFATLSALWAVDAAATLARVPKVWAVVLAGGLVIAAARDTDDATRRRVMIALTAGLLIACLPPLVDRVFGITTGPGELSRYNRGLSTDVLLVWPASLLLVRCGSRRWLVVLWLVTAVTVFALESDSAKLAVLTGVAAAGLAWRAPRRTPVLLAGIAVVYIALAPLVHRNDVLPLTRWGVLPAPADKQSWLPFSARHRLAIWQFTAERIADRPLLGWGFNSARRLPGERGIFGGPALHPHNAVIQLWVELGAVGAALGAALAVWAAVRMRRISEPAASAAAAGYFASAVTLLCLAFGVWQSWWLAALFLSTGLLAAALPRDG